jgi:PII-like signaling protein
MKEPADAILLRAFIVEDDKCEGLPLYEAIVLRARDMHLAGATVLRGPIGFGSSDRIRTTKLLRLSFDLPIIVEIVDTQQHIDEFLPILDELMPTGIVTLEKVAVKRYGPSERQPQSG